MRSIWVIPVLASILILGALDSSLLSAEAGEEKTPISFSWDPADTSDDLDHLIIIFGTFERQGPIPDSAIDVQGELAGTLKSKIKNESTMTETIDGTTTITTTAEAHSQKAGKFQGTITIDGEEFSVKFNPSGDATILQETRVSTGTIDLTINREILTISGTVMMCNDDKECLEGFGIIRSQSSQSSDPLFGSVTFVSDLLEAKVIGDDGLFELELNRLERIVGEP